LRCGKTLVDVLNGEAVWPPPVWIMRQAGRYLPEYRALRAKAGSFWNLCMTPDWAAEATLQPIRRFGFDAAIIFSDILVVAAALGREVSFADGEGPRMEAVTSAKELSEDVDRRALEPVYEALRIARAKLDGGTALLGFAGAPWTLATYLAAGMGGDEQKAAKLWAYRDPDGFGLLVDRLTDCIVVHLIGQLKAGADAVQIFDSWAQGLPDAFHARWVITPTKRIVETVRAAVPGAKIVGFPRASTLAGYERYARETGVDAVSLDTAAPMGWAAETLSPHVACQGNLDPIALIAGAGALRDGVTAILDSMRGKRLIFNLGHGILPETPPEHVEELIGLVRAR
jgi:uroporphyrinogen decarboxylase